MRGDKKPSHPRKPLNTGNGTGNVCFMSTDKPTKPAKAPALDLAAELKQANTLAQELHADLTASRAEVARLTSALNAATAANAKAEERASQAEAARQAALDSVPQMASRQAAVILGGVGHAPLPAGQDSHKGASGSPSTPEEIRAAFARMTPGTAEATAFWKQHRAVLIGR